VESLRELKALTAASAEAMAKAASPSKLRALQGKDDEFAEGSGDSDGGGGGDAQWLTCTCRWDVCV